MVEMKVYTNPLAVMVEIMQAVARRGYTHYVTGEVPICKALALVMKFIVKYHIDMNTNQRAYRKRKGKANCVLFLYLESWDKPLRFYLLITPGEGRVWREERPLDVRDNPIIVPDAVRRAEYALVRKPPAKGGNIGWTWMLTSKSVVRWLEWLCDAARHHRLDQALKRLELLNSTPGFHGIRQRAEDIKSKFFRCWRRHNAKRELPKIPLIGYISYRKFEAGRHFVHLSDLVDRLCK